MMDLDEARVSLDYYSNILDFQFGLYSFTVGLAKSEKIDKEIEPQVTGLEDEVVADLRRLQRESLILGIKINRAIARETERLVHLPRELTKLLEAKNRNTLALNKSSNLLREHDQKEVEKNRKEAQENEPKILNATQLAIQEYREITGRKKDPNGLRLVPKTPS